MLLRVTVARRIAVLLEIDDEHIRPAGEERWLARVSIRYRTYRRKLLCRDFISPPLSPLMPRRAERCAYFCDAATISAVVLPTAIAVDDCSRH